MARFNAAFLFAAILALSLSVAFPARAAQTWLEPAFQDEGKLEPAVARGVVIWSHGRSINSEDSEAPTPYYLRTLREAGWEVLRFNRLRDGDTLRDSSRELASRAAELKTVGYRRVSLSGQSFGAFLSLMAANATQAVDSVVATAPAAFGSFDDYYDTWQLNATRLYPLLDGTHRARIMLFFFHGDEFDPGGRGARARAILAAKEGAFSIVDQPPLLVSHWAATTGAFMRRYGPCIREFLEADSASGEWKCEPSWGRSPSAALILPDNVVTAALVKPSSAVPSGTGADAVATGASMAPAGVTDESKAAEGSGGGEAPAESLDTWYGFYPNGREVLLAVESSQDDTVTALYAIGPGIDGGQSATWVRRTGKILDRELVFAEPGHSTIRFKARDDGGLNVSWTAPDGGLSMQSQLRRIEPVRVAPLASAHSTKSAALAR